MDKKSFGKKIVSSTILFICIILFVGVFKLIFGDENTSVGVTTIIALLILMGKDLTKKPIKNLVLLLAINLYTGIAVFIAANNMWVGIIVDFISLSLLGYYLGYTLTKALILPYGLQYLFMLFEPVYGIHFVKRLLGLAFAAVLIMASQYLVNRKSKNLNKESELIIIEEDKSDSVYKEVSIFGRKVKVHTIRASYAMRIGILVALTTFLTQFFKLNEGRWMAYTVFSVTEFYSANCRIRAKKRIQGTIIGVIIVMILFLFIKSTALRGLIILVAGYLNSFFDNYRDIMILTTISAVTPIALSNGSIYAVVERLTFVIIGVILALIFNMFNKAISKEKAA